MQNFQTTPLRSSFWVNGGLISKQNLKDQKLSMEINLLLGMCNKIKLNHF